VLADPRRSGTGRDHRPASLAANRTIALDQPSTRALHDHRQRLLKEPEPHDRVFTTPPRGLRGGTPLAANNFARIWKPALAAAGLDHAWPRHGGLHNHDYADLRVMPTLAMKSLSIGVIAASGSA